MRIEQTENIKRYYVGNYRIDIFNALNKDNYKCLVCQNENTCCYLWKGDNPDSHLYHGSLCGDCVFKYNLESPCEDKIKSGIALLKMKEVI